MKQKTLVAGAVTALCIGPTAVVVAAFVPPQSTGDAATLIKRCHAGQMARATEWLRLAH
jgi:hypothetical protein